MASAAPQLLIRADAGGENGIGHIMRMIALAQAWQDAQGSVVLAYISCPPSLLTRLNKESITLVRLDVENAGSESDATATIQLAQSYKSSWIALDGYFITVKYQKLVKDAGLKLLMVDDYGHCDSWHSDLLLNQNLHAVGMKENYLNSSVNQKFLLGPKYVLLRREFKKNRKTVLAKKEEGPVRVLVTFGGVDPNNWTLKLLKIILKCNCEMQVTVIIGAGYKDRDELFSLSNTDKISIDIQSNVEDMPSAYLSSDCIISAAGSSTYEWLRYGLPALVFVIADNQRPIASCLEKVEQVEVFDDLLINAEDRIMRLIRNLVGNAPRIEKGPPAIDANGADRVVSEMLN